MLLPSLRFLRNAKNLSGRMAQAYSHERLHSGIGYVTPADKLNGLAEAICKERYRKLEETRARRAAARAAAREVA